MPKQSLTSQPLNEQQEIKPLREPRCVRPQSAGDFTDGLGSAGGSARGSAGGSGSGEPSAGRDSAEPRPGPDSRATRSGQRFNGAPHVRATSGGQRRRPLYQLGLLVGVCLLPVILSYVAYYLLPPTGRSNRGDLVDPQRPVPVGFPMSQPGNGADALSNLTGRWALVVQGDRGCDEICARRLYVVRQTQAAMGRERERVAQVLLLTDDQPLRTELHSVHPNLIVLHGDASTISAFLDVGRPADYFVIDPQQHLMMTYPPDPDPAGIRKDLNRLLRASRVG